MTRTGTTDWADDPAPESRDVARLRPRYGPVVDGRPVDGGGETRLVDEPGTGGALAEVGTASAADVDAAVRAAGRAEWAALRGAERARALFRLAGLVRDRAAELAVLEALESGAPVRTTRGADLPAVADALFSAAGWADKLSHAGLGADPRPVGVVAHVVVAGAPLLTTARALGPALAAGCPVVVVPVQGVLATTVLAELCADAGLPPGTVQVLPGGVDVATALVAHDGVDAVAAFGRGAVRRTRPVVAGSGRRFVAVPDALAAVVVYDDAPFDQAVDGIVALFEGRGAGARLVVQEPVVDELLAAVRARAAALRVGDPLDRGTDVGAVASPGRLRRIHELLDAATADGAERWTGPQDLPGRGSFAAPVLLTEVSPTMRVAQGPVVGPVLPVLTFRTPDEAVATADATAATAAVVWTDKGSRALWTAQRLRAGTVRVNSADATDPSPRIEAYLRG